MTSSGIACSWRPEALDRALIRLVIGVKVAKVGDRQQLLEVVFSLPIRSWP